MRGSAFWVTAVAEAGLAGKGTLSHLGVEKVHPWPFPGRGPPHPGSGGPHALRAESGSWGESGGSEVRAVGRS